MSDQSAFIRAMWERPDDDSPRLVYADWLEEQGEAERAEFIRTQVELEPVRDEDGKQAEQLWAHSQALLNRNRTAWLAPLTEAAIMDLRFSPQWRRGMVHSAVACADGFVARADPLSTACPLLRELTLVGCAGRGEALADSVYLNCYPWLQFADWLTPDDARALAASTNLDGLESLTLWLGSEHDEAVCQAFANPRRFAGLRELRLVQARGELPDDAETARFRLEAERHADEFNAHRGTRVAKVVRPWERLLLFRDKVGGGVYAGRLANGRQTIAFLEDEERPVLAQFDDAGALLEMRHPDLPSSWHRVRFHEEIPAKQITDYLTRTLLLRLGTVRVQPFQLPGMRVHVPWPRVDDGSDSDDRQDCFAHLAAGEFRVDRDWHQRWVGPEGRYD